MPNWPEWWEWDLEIIDHAVIRMDDRSFTEVDLREMMETATRLRKGRKPGRWIIETRHEGRRWHVVVEPLAETRILEVVTAYPVVKL
jgi:hypothetical protein